MDRPVNVDHPAERNSRRCTAIAAEQGIVNSTRRVQVVRMQHLSVNGATVTLDAASIGVTITPMPPTEISIKELHGATGEIVRRAGASRIPLVITDHGEPVAILANPNVVSQVRPRRNSLLPEFAEFLKRGTRTDVQSDLDDVRGDR